MWLPFTKTLISPEGPSGQGELVTKSEQSREIHTNGKGAQLALLVAVNRVLALFDNALGTFRIRNKIAKAEFLHNSWLQCVAAFGMIPQLFFGGETDAPGGKKSSHPARETRPDDA